MRTTILITAVFLLVAQKGDFAHGQTAGSWTLDQLSWMAGHWVGKDERAVETEELWLLPKGGMMLGLHRDVPPSGRGSFEFLRIAESGGKIVYLASPAGRPATEFTLTSVADFRAVFENQAHDFPQRIVYWREGEQLHARVEGEVAGELKSQEWSWRKQSQPAGVKK